LGLSFNNTTGAITGTPVGTSPATNYTITAYNGYGGNSTTVNLKVIANTKLSNLVFSSGALTPAFVSTTTSYTQAVGNATASVTVTPTTQDPLATVTVNGVNVSSGTPSGSIPLNVGSNVITTLVTAQDETLTKTYTVTITRAPSSNDNLSSLKLSAGTLSPVFAAGTTSYTANVANGTASITITPTAADPTATMQVNGNTVASGAASGAIALNIGSNVITTVVTAQDGVTAQTYTVTVTRAAANNANLASLVLNGVGPLTPVFAPATTSYTANVGNGVASVTETPKASDAGATLTVNGVAITSGNTTSAIPLTVGSNIITTVVTAQDGVTTKTYTVTLTRASSGDATLSNLVVSSGSLTPAFAPGTSSYSESVPNATSGITVTPTTNNATATVKVNGATVSSGTPSNNIPLNVGSNTITVLVAASNGTATKTYTLMVTRAASSNAGLAGLVPSAGALSPSFGTAITSYSLNENNSVTSITVTPTTSDATATVKVNGTAVTSGSPSAAIPLNVGYDTVSTVVTAQDGVTVQIYTIVVNRAVSTNANLASLVLNKVGPLTPVFSPATTSYTANVGNSFTSVTVTPKTSDATATVTVNGASVTSGGTSAAIALNVGANKITTVVTAQDGVTTKTYTVTLTRATPPGNIPDESVSVAIPEKDIAFDEDVVIVHQAISPNGDGVNDFLQIDGILAYPDNKLAIMNRDGLLVFEAKGYDNANKVFDGHSNKTGAMQLPGTYFYALDYTVKGITKHKTGFLVLKY
jgi:gliding motility-associated-like protein